MHGYKGANQVQYIQLACFQYNDDINKGFTEYFKQFLLGSFIFLRQKVNMGNTVKSLSGCTWQNTVCISVTFDMQVLLKAKISRTRQVKDLIQKLRQPKTRVDILGLSMPTYSPCEPHASVLRHTSQESPSQHQDSQNSYSCCLCSLWL